MLEPDYGKKVNPGEVQNAGVRAVDAPGAKTVPHGPLKEKEKSLV